MRRTTLILAAIAVALTGVVVGARAPPAQAHDHLVPKTDLKKGQRELQTGRRVAWDAVFHVNRPGRYYYLMTEGHWQDRHGCGGDQYAYWSFHVKTGAPYSNRGYSWDGSGPIALATKVPGSSPPGGCAVRQGVTLLGGTMPLKEREEEADAQLRLSV